MKYKLLVLDIDGTLTNSQKKITDVTLNALLDLQERGVKVVLASGRPTPGVLPLAKQLKLEQYGSFVLSYNGARVMNCQTGEVIYQNVISHKDIPVLYDAAVKHNVGIITYEEEGVISGRGSDSFIELEARINNIPIKCVDDFPNYVTFDVNKCLMTGEGDYLAKVEQEMKKEFEIKFLEFGKRFSIYRSEPFFLEIMPQNIDKAFSLNKLLQHLNISKEEMICCGDGFNDMSMIQFAGLGVAMANAQEPVREIADYITLSNDEDGIVHVIDRFILS